MTEDTCDRQPSQSPGSGRGRLQRMVRGSWPSILIRGWPLLVLLALLLWGWRRLSLVYSIPAYGDTLEMMWVLSWYGDALRTGQSIDVYPLAFYPGGWRYNDNLYMLLSMLPLHWLAGPAFAYNLVVLLSFIVAFLGGYVLAREFVSRGPATVAAVLVAFWGARWFHTFGHANILIGSALAPWALWTLNRGLRAARRAALWFAVTGVLWVLSMSGSLYFAPLVGMAVLAWITGALSARTIDWRRAAAGLVIPGAIALLLGAPYIYWMASSSAQVGVPFYNFGEVNFWGASLNNLPIPSLDHPWLGQWARSIYRGLPYEQGMINLGLLAVLLALAGLWSAARQKTWRPVIFLTAASLVLTLGLTLKWDNESLQWPWLRPVTAVLWSIGHSLKPGFFVGDQPPEQFQSAVPLPAMILTALVPYLERARVFARYALVGGVGVFLLASMGLEMVRNRWVRVAVALLVLVEVLPAPLTRLPYPPASHPAFEWLRQQPLADESIADLIAAHPFTPALYIEGETVLATHYHGKPTVAGASSIWPAYTSFLYEWLASHEHAFWNLDLVPILRFYGVRYILLHEKGEWERGLLEEAKQNDELRFLQCFDPSSEPGPWNYPICIVEVLPSANPNINLVLGDGWSGAEDWGVWAEGHESSALWIATEQAEHRLQVEAFPACLDAPDRSITLEMNGSVLATHLWVSCDPWTTEIMVPADLVRLGPNSLVIRSSHAARPSDRPGDTSGDTRLLSAGFTKLKIEAPVH